MRLPWNWRNRLEIVFDDLHWDGKLRFILQFKAGTAPRGCHYEIGRLEVEPDFVVYNVEIEPRFRGKGLGKMLYLAALKHCGHLTTYYHYASEEAQRVWKSLIRDHKYETDFLKGILTIYS